jgi:hypothetical protein
MGAFCLSLSKLRMHNDREVHANSNILNAEQIIREQQLNSHRDHCHQMNHNSQHNSQHSIQHSTPSALGSTGSQIAPSDHKSLLQWGQSEEEKANPEFWTKLARFKTVLPDPKTHIRPIENKVYSPRVVSALCWAYASAKYYDEAFMVAVCRDVCGQGGAEGRAPSNNSSSTSQHSADSASIMQNARVYGNRNLSTVVWSVASFSCSVGRVVQDGMREKSFNI